MLGFDNIEDCQAKLAGTICTYGGNAIKVKSVHHDPEHMNENFILSIGAAVKNFPQSINLNDPLFECQNFNIGYSNQHGVAGWFYRRPLKQYRQGLRGDQMNRLVSNEEYYHNLSFDYHGSIIQMLENRYPNLATCEERLKCGDALIMAFSKNFAANYDRIHEDMIVEYKGKKIGKFSSLKDFKLLDEYKYLTESLMETLNVSE